MASTGEVWKLGHRPALDGVRGIAVLLVVVTHVGIPHLRASGVVGVTMFFTLSGFLITTLLLDEHSATGRIDLVRFYRRRALRLLPALVVMLAVVGGVFVAAGYSLRWLFHETAPVMLYYGNWVRASGDHLGMWSHTWSLAVEEQFYLIWPVALILLARFGRAAVIATCVAGAVYSVTARIVAWDGGDGLNRVYYGSDMHLDALLLGALLAVVMRGSRDGEARGWWAGVLAALLAAWGVAGNGFAVYGIGLAVVPALTVPLVFLAARGEGVRWLRWPPLVTVGRRSYGLYLWHYPFSFALTFVDGGWQWVAVPVVVAASWWVTCLSLRYVEQPFLRIKDRRPESDQRSVVHGHDRGASGAARVDAGLGAS